MNGYSLTSDQRLKIVSLLIEHALSTHPSMEEILSSGFRGFMNLSDRELVESAQECSLDLPQGIDLPGNDGANRTYRVTWVIDIEEATGPHEAAEISGRRTTWFSGVSRLTQDAQAFPSQRPFGLCGQTRRITYYSHACKLRRRQEKLAAAKLTERWRKASAATFASCWSERSKTTCSMKSLRGTGEA